MGERTKIKWTVNMMLSLKTNALEEFLLQCHVVVDLCCCKSCPLYFCHWRSAFAGVVCATKLADTPYLCLYVCLCVSMYVCMYVRSGFAGALRTIKLSHAQYVSRYV